MTQITLKICSLFSKKHITLLTLFFLRMFCSQALWTLKDFEL